MSILHLLNIADFVFMAAGVAVALLMIVMGDSEERRKTDRLGQEEAPKRQRRQR
jgi:hypothetical protein